MSDSALTPEEIVKKLQVLTHDLYYLSEADYPVEVMQLKLETCDSIQESDILKLAGKPTVENIEIGNLNQFFRNMLNPEIVGEEMAAQYQELKCFLEQYLSALKVYLIGETEVQVLVLGKLTAEEYIGLKTTIVQT